MITRMFTITLEENHGNGSMTEWSPIRSVIQNCTKRSPTINAI